MAAMTRMPPVLARRAHRVDQIVIIAGGARRMRAVGDILVIAAEDDGKDRALARCTYASSRGQR